jgi:serine/threonine protein kinase/DNA-binding SARP family transcriptional activator
LTPEQALRRRRWLAKNGRPDNNEADFPLEPADDLPGHRISQKNKSKILRSAAKMAAGEANHEEASHAASAGYCCWQEQSMSNTSPAGYETFPPDLAPRIDRVCERFKEAWMSGQRPKIEELTQSDFEGDERVALTEKLVALEIDYRRRAGEDPQAEQYATRFPFLEPEWLARVLGETMVASDGLPTPVADSSGLVGKSTRIRCPHCSNPIRLQDDRSDKVLCPGCGSSFHVREARPAKTTQSMRPLGKFQLLERVGVGAFGAVWRARDTELDRIVALKIPHTGLLTSQADLERFQREARAAAQLRHPGIVTVHEVVTLEGIPTIVADFIRGVTLKDFLAARRLTFHEVVALLAEVADAVDYAHSMGLVHRDLKPGNIMLETSGVLSSSPTTPHSPLTPHPSPLVPHHSPKIMDFGLALRDDAEITITQDGDIIGTPAYMSPEQAAGKGHQADRRSDIYSLGVIFYQALCGELPFRGSQAMIVYQVISEEPRPPRQINDKIPRDLETICVKALAKAPAQRYQSARELAEDLRRYLRNEPIRARPAGRFERMRRWCRRNPVVAALTAAVALVLVAGTAVSCYFAVDALRQKQQAEKDRENAVSAEADTQAFSRFLATHVLAAARPAGLHAGIGWDVKMTDALAAAEKHIDDTFRGRPKAEALARDAIGVTWLHLGRYQEGERQLRRAIALREQVLGPDDPDTLKTGNDLGILLAQAGRTGEAIPLLEQVRDKQIEKLGPDHPHTLNTLNSLATAYQAAGKISEAIRLYTELHDKKVEKLGPDDPSTLTTLNNLAAAYQAARKMPEAIRLYEQVRDKSIEKLGPDHPDTLVTLNNLGSALQVARRFSEAISLLEQVRDKQVEKLGADHPDTLSTLNNLALAYQGNGQLTEAIRVFEEVRDKQMERLGADHPATLVTLHNLARARRTAGDLTEANRLFEQVSDKSVEKLGADHPNTLSAMYELASGLRAAGKLAEAIRLFEQVRDKQVEKLGLEHPHTVNTLGQLGKAYVEAGQVDKALPVLDQFIVARRKASEPDDPRFAGLLARVSVDLIKHERFSRAEKYLRESLAIQEKKQPDAWTTFHAKSLLGGALAGQKRYSDAEPLLLQAYEGMKQRKANIPAEDKPRLMESLERLIRLYDSWSKPDQADRWRKEMEGPR